MIEVELGDLKRLGEEISKTLTGRLDVKVTVKGRSLIIPDAAGAHSYNVKDIKEQVKYTLRHLGLSEQYRALVEQHKVRIAKVPEKPKVTKTREGSTPTPSSTLPYFFP